MIELSILIVIFLFFRKSKKRVKTNSFYVSGNRNYTIDNLNRGLIAIGGAGSGKTYSMIKPLLGYCIKHKGCLTFDPKGELSPLINDLAEKNKKKVLNFSLDNNYDALNPLSLCNDKSDVIEFSSYFLSGIVGIPKNDNAKYFFNAAKSVLTGVIIYFKNTNSKYATIPHIIALFLTASGEDILKLLSSDPEARRASMILSSVKKDPRLMGNIISTFTAFFSSLDTPTIFSNLVSEEQITMPNDPNNPSIINLIFNLQKRDLYTPIYSSIVGLILKKMNTPNQHESAVIIDEFTVLSIPNFVNIPETARSNKIATCIAIQDLSQLVSKYGREEASSIVSNMGSQFLFRTTNPETLTHFERMLGTREVSNISYTRSTGISLKASKNTGVRDKNILRKESIINYRPGQVFGIISEGSSKLIEGSRIHGNHYLKDSKKNGSFKYKISDTDVNTVYQQVYNDIDSILTTSNYISPSKFNI
ncbi:type IV secretory system conjugative DNA transfer family protein [uncultured Dokdonia sp.]|uniref:type IV secretory system conjugative DNA transfer family protein n=1 Tax=uncultured Dokdonia sp. TaxID=575653 RepID=UPI0026293CA3|nr:type IV secretory system conjugative DNA transfer family protein [uncultured Dokdonia sp.]